jgi:hypothetical protein
MTTNDQKPIFAYRCQNCKAVYYSKNEGCPQCQKPLPDTQEFDKLYMHFIDERGKSVSTAMRITPQDTIAALHQQINDLKEQVREKDCRTAFLETELEIVRGIASEGFERITSLQAENKRLREGWVRCSDKMPENLKEVLAYVEREEQMVVAVYEKGEGWYETYNDATIEYPVTHWMPLPTPPAQTDNDKKEMV